MATDEEIGGEIVKIGTSLIGAIAGLFSPPAGKVITEVGQVAGVAIGEIGKGKNEESGARVKTEGAPYPVVNDQPATVSQKSIEHKESGVKIDRTYANAVLTKGVAVDEEGEKFVPTPRAPYWAKDAKSDDDPDVEDDDELPPPDHIYWKSNPESDKDNKPASSPPISSAGRFLANLFGSSART